MFRFQRPFWPGTTLQNSHDEPQLIAVLCEQVLLPLFDKFRNFTAGQVNESKERATSVADGIVECVPILAILTIVIRNHVSKMRRLFQFIVSAFGPTFQYFRDPAARECLFVAQFCVKASVASHPLQNQLATHADRATANREFRPVQAAQGKY